MNKLFCTVTLFVFSVITVFSQTLSKSEQQRLLSFCKLYSTVKYYYPDPNLQDFPWDALAFRGYQLAKSATSDEEFVRKVDSLFRIIAPGVQITKKGFDLSRITPEDTSRYYRRAFWQHNGGLSTGKPLESSTATLNYIYRKPTEDYHFTRTLPSKDLQGKNLRISLWAKVERLQDSVRVFRYRFLNRETGKNTYIDIDIKAAGNEWQCYEKEFRHSDEPASPVDMLRIFHINENTSPTDELCLFHPRRGTVYVNSLMLEVQNGEKWEEITIFTPLSAWSRRYFYKNFAFTDSINVLNGKRSLRLPAVQSQLLYPPVPVDKPHSVLLRGGYQAYIPLQLYANTATVFPLTSRQAIKNLSKELQKDSLSASQSFITYAMQTWAALYHDYPYRDAGFEDKLNRLLLQTIERLETDTATIPHTILTQSFLMWINDPHLQLDGKISKGELANRNRIDLPIKPYGIALNETQCVVNNVIEGEINLQAGDVLLRINNVSIDSLLQVYRKHHISRNIQRIELLRLTTTFGKPEMGVQLLRNGQKKNVVFTGNKQQTGSIKLREERAKYQAIQDSLKKTQAVFYLNAMCPPDSIFNRSPVRTTERTVSQYHAADSLIAELNRYKALILDVRGRPQNTSIGILFYLNQCMGVDLNRNSDVLKTAIFPVAQFSRDTLNFYLLDIREDVLIQVPVYVLIDEKTISAPERELIALRESGRATFIGSNTAGAAGPVCRQQIADNVRLVYTTGQTVGLDNNPMSYQGTGIPPDIHVYPTPQGIREGRDEVLEKAVEIALGVLKK